MAEARDLVIEVQDLAISVSSLDESVVEEAAGRRRRVTLAADVLFAFNRATLTPAARGRLRDVARRLRSARGPVRIDGYTDSKGSPAYNLRLSRRRAAAVRAALARQVGGNVRFQVAGHGEANPVAANFTRDGSDNPRGRAKNRRVTITFR